MESLKRDIQIANWKSLIQARINSGMTIAQWCRENNLSENSYYYWLKVIRRETLAQHAANTLVPENIRTQEFVELPSAVVQAAAESTARPAAVLRKGGICIELYADTPQPLIETLIGGLAHA